jgi:hypothetical protein
MLLSHPEEIAAFPREMVVCDWLYSQTGTHAASVHGWRLPGLAADTYADVDDPRTALYESYWAIDAPDFPQQFYQFPYLPFLRDRGFDVLAGPATLYAGNALSGTHLPNARANQRGWWDAAARFDGIGALNTCWAIRGALRESTRAGHRAFLAIAADSSRDDADVSTACWQEVAGPAASQVAAAIDALAPPVDVISRTHPLVFDTTARVHRSQGVDGRADALCEAARKATDTDVDAYAAARARAQSLAEILDGVAESDLELRAWRLNADESDLRAAVWQLARARETGGVADAGPLPAMIDAQAGAVAAFMRERYLPADVATVQADRYAALQRLVRTLAGG